MTAVVRLVSLAWLIGTVSTGILPAQVAPPHTREPGDAESTGGAKTVLHAVADAPIIGADQFSETATPAQTDQALNDLLRSRVRRRGFATDDRSGRPLRGYRFYGNGYPHYIYDSMMMLEDAYVAGRIDERDSLLDDFNLHDMNERKQRLLSAHEKATHSGTMLLKQGKYQQAVVALTLASELNQGDPGCRIKLALARMANGHYQEAAAALRRALQLQPKLVYINLELSDGYPSADDFNKQVDALASHVKSGSSSDASFLLGYMEFQRGNYDAAHAAFRKAAKLGCSDDAVKSYLSITKPSVASVKTQP